MNYKDLFNVSPPGSDRDFAKAVLAKQEQPRVNVQTPLYNLAAAAVVLIAGTVFMFSAFRGDADVPDIFEPADSTSAAITANAADTADTANTAHVTEVGIDLANPATTAAATTAAAQIGTAVTTAPNANGTAANGNNSGTGVTLLEPVTTAVNANIANLTTTTTTVRQTATTTAPAKTTTPATTTTAKKEQISLSEARKIISRYSRGFYRYLDGYIDTNDQSGASCIADENEIIPGTRFTPPANAYFFSYLPLEKELQGKAFWAVSKDDRAVFKKVDCGCHLTWERLGADVRDDTLYVNKLNTSDKGKIISGGIEYPMLYNIVHSHNNTNDNEFATTWGLRLSAPDIYKASKLPAISYREDFKIEIPGYPNIPLREATYNVLNEDFESIYDFVSFHKNNYFEWGQYGDGAYGSKYPIKFIPPTESGVYYLVINYDFVYDSFVDCEIKRENFQFFAKIIVP